MAQDPTPHKSFFNTGKWTNAEVDGALLEVLGNINKTVLELFYDLFTDAVFSSSDTSLLNLFLPCLFALLVNYFGLSVISKLSLMFCRLAMCSLEKILLFQFNVLIIVTKF